MEGRNHIVHSPGGGIQMRCEALQPKPFSPRPPTTVSIPFIAKPGHPGATRACSAPGKAFMAHATSPASGSFTGLGAGWAPARRVWAKERPPRGSWSQAAELSMLLLSDTSPFFRIAAIIFFSCKIFCKTTTRHPVREESAPCPPPSHMLL